ncbi:CobW family GTP-binding protein [Phosphitispora fastidiosa]|uniref:CobW family GTP-binding protein n=1 Tax=Phosphitispora fastidiosa TaxID=2837202 RepID=UPI001E2F3949|nr:GTP-binding protein [Phosphitispora fastidiosa]MBU7008007.1 G3E family GTPase [Phosphitispora fastidiosa]
MKVQLICGFLGAGKTTLLKQLIREHGADTAILVNEFGELGIDGALISEGNNLNVVEMPSGCICCSLRESLVDAVREIMEDFNPGQLIIEPSGIASPSSILLGLKNADFAEKLAFTPVIGVIDMTFFIEVIREGDIGNFFLDQIKNSDIVLLNKADLVSAEVTEECSRGVLEINPSAIIIPTVYCKAEIPEMAAKDEVSHFHYSPQFHAESFTFDGIVKKEKIIDLLNSLKGGEYGNVYRAKGIIRTDNGSETFDYVNGQVNFGTIGKAEQNKLVFIGLEVNRSKIENAVRS